MTLKTKVNLIISIAIVVLALPAAALADSGLADFGDGNLKVAIDDGSGEYELFVYIDSLDDLRTDDYEITAETDACRPGTGARQLRGSVAINSQVDVMLASGVTVLSRCRIDAETQAQIRTLLANTGHENVVFIDETTAGIDAPAVHESYDSNKEQPQEIQTSNQ